MDKLYKREKYLRKIRGFYGTADIIKVITGLRRCGKSSIMRLIADELLDKGTPSENLVFISLDSKEHKRIKNQRN